MRLLLAAAAALLVLAPPAGATFPGRNGELVYTADRTGETALAAIAQDGGGYRELSLCADPEWGPCGDGWAPMLRSPRASPRGQAIVVAAEARPYDPLRPQESGFGFMAFDGSGADYHRGEIVNSIAWSPSGRMILAETLEALWLMEVDGDEPRLLIHGGRAPDWARNGRIVYESGSDLWIRSRSGARRRLTRRGGAEPSWSPDARRIAFERRGQIYVVTSGGRRTRRLTRRGGSRPAWSPDGRRIAFVRRDRLYTMRPDGTGLRAVTPAGQRVTDVDWRRLP